MRKQIYYISANESRDPITGVRRECEIKNGANRVNKTSRKERKRIMILKRRRRNGKRGVMEQGCCRKREIFKYNEERGKQEEMKSMRKKEGHQNKE